MLAARIFIMHKPLICLLAGMTALSAWAQKTTDTLSNRSLTIERNYTPVLQDAQKIYVAPTPVEISLPRRDVTYSTYDRTLIPELSIKPLAAAGAVFPDVSDYKGFARVGLGLYWNTLADFKYRMLDDERSAFDVDLHHIGTFARRKSSVTDIDLNFTQHLDAVSLYGGIAAEHNLFNYYGRYYRPQSEDYDWTAARHNDSTYLNNLWNFGFRFGVKSAAEQETKFYAQVGYELTSVADYDLYLQPMGLPEDYRLTEHRIRVQGGAEWLLEVSRLGFNADITSNFYKRAEGAYHNRPFVTVKLEPYYAVTGQKAWLHVGANIDMSMGRGKVFGVSPNVIGEWQAQPEMLAIYAAVGGRYDARNLHDVMSENRYAMPLLGVADTLNSYTPVDIRFGLKIHPVSGLLINPFAQFEYTKDDLCPLATDLGTFGMVKTDMRHFKVGMSANYHFGDVFDISGMLAYNQWTAMQLEHAWYRPSFEARLSGRLHVLKKWSFQLDSYFTDKVYGGVCEVLPGTPPTTQVVEHDLSGNYDINLGATYLLTDRISFFGNLNNIFSSKDYPLYGYMSEGINFVLGASFQF
ncbi:MAG: hypothetical protein IJ680_05530 [Paludibacteraceae bacterium]|nr:hypothetical protein [Paludibacteraceae bacterium]